MEVGDELDKFIFANEMCKKHMKTFPLHYYGSFDDNFTKLFCSGRISKKNADGSTPCNKKFPKSEAFFKKLLIKYGYMDEKGIVIERWRLAKRWN